MLPERCLFITTSPINYAVPRENENIFYQDGDQIKKEKISPQSETSTNTIICHLPASFKSPCL
jgi:hypothetical protein